MTGSFQNGPFMNEIGTDTRSHVMAGDLAVDGIFTGIEAGIIMAAFLVVVLVGQDFSPAEVLSVFTLYGSPSLTSGILAHLAVSRVYGIFFILGM